MRIEKGGPSASQSILGRIAALGSQFSAVEARIAENVLAHPYDAIRSSTEQLAESCGVSEASITRFCQRIGCAGFKELKIMLAQEVGSLSPKMSHEDVGQDGVDYVTQVFQQSVDGMRRTLEALNRDQLTCAIRAIAEARAVDIYGAGESHVVGESLELKLRRLGIAASLPSTTYLRSMSIGSLQAGDVAIGISLSGCTRETVDAIALAANREVTTIAITNFPEFLLGEISDIVLRTDTVDTMLPHGSIASRHAQYLIVDLVAVGLLVNYRAKYLKAYEHYSRMIAEHGR